MMKHEEPQESSPMDDNNASPSSWPGSGRRLWLPRLPRMVTKVTQSLLLYYVLLQLLMVDVSVAYPLSSSGFLSSNDYAGSSRCLNRCIILGMQYKHYDITNCRTICGKRRLEGKDVDCNKDPDSDACSIPDVRDNIDDEDNDTEGILQNKMAAAAAAEYDDDSAINERSSESDDVDDDVIIGSSGPGSAVSSMNRILEILNKLEPHVSGSQSASASSKIRSRTGSSENMMNSDGSRSSLVDSQSSMSSERKEALMEAEERANILCDHAKWDLRYEKKTEYKQLTLPTVLKRRWGNTIGNCITSHCSGQTGRLRVVCISKMCNRRRRSRYR